MTARQDRVARPGRWLPLGVLLVFAAAYGVFQSHVPKEQHLRFVLGDSAPAITELQVRYEEPGKAAEYVREATFRYAPGEAPRVVPHEPELSDGDYELEIEVQTRGGRRTVTRRVTLSGGTTSVDLEGTAPTPPDAGGVGRPRP